MAKRRSKPKSDKSAGRQSRKGKAQDTADSTSAAADQNGASEANGGETTGGYFRRLFTEHPKWLTASTNADIVQRWLADNPGVTEMPKNIKNNLANVKSVLRSKLRKKPGRKPRAEQAESAGDQETRRSSGSQSLEMIEEQIDECLTLAKTLDRDGLEEVIRLLRRARNEVVWKMGQYRTASQPFDPGNDSGSDLRPKPERVQRLGRDVPQCMYTVVAPEA